MALSPVLRAANCAPARPRRVQPPADDSLVGDDDDSSVGSAITAASGAAGNDRLPARPTSWSSALTPAEAMLFVHRQARRYGRHAGRPLGGQPGKRVQHGRQASFDVARAAAIHPAVANRGVQGSIVMPVTGTVS